MQLIEIYLTNPYARPGREATRHSTARLTASARLVLPWKRTEPIERKQGGKTSSRLSVDGGSPQPSRAVKACAYRFRFQVEVLGGLFHIESSHIVKHDDRPEKWRELIDGTFQKSSDLAAGHFRLWICN